MDVLAQLLSLGRKDTTTQSFSLEVSAGKQVRNMKELAFPSKADLRGPQTKPTAASIPSKL